MKTDTCEVCGRQLSSEESIERHKGMRCHVEWLERRVAELELEVALARAVVGNLMKCNQKRNVKEVKWTQSRILAK